MIMAELTRRDRLFSARVVGTDTVDGVPCIVDAKKSFLSGCRYDVILDTPGRQDEPRIVASGTFAESLWALKRSEEAKGCAGLLKAVSLCLRDPESDLTRRFSDAELSVLALLVAEEMTLGRMSGILRSPESSVELALRRLRDDALVWRRSAANHPDRPYVLSGIGMSTCELMREDERFVEAARRIIRSGG